MTADVRTKAFYALLKQAKIPRPVPEFRFHPTRKWRIDFAWPSMQVGLEVDGGVWRGGRHTRGAGWIKDTEKLNTAVSMGWRMLRCMPSTLCDAETIRFLKDTLAL